MNAPDPFRPRVERVLSDLPNAGAEEAFDDLHSATGAWRLERIVSRGQVSDGWYDQDWDEWVLLLQGHAVIEVQVSAGPPESLPLEAGEAVYLPAHVKHRVIHTDSQPPTVWLALHIGETAG